ncbi:uncharacterized protein KY384_002825 [Bacidia gigantensis]|uniref:uncharacterized protein n=1 Tax=Bacidia gigantensis TaxID=2732470 RepID=UPI001D03F830|nr:uncharacterized protein KY384_002825 [Bacidia gigantensis]KAG8532947.1 hypothetical protein KY384_002825 [Bacidia gigantensis]
MQLYTLNTSRISETFQKDLGLPPPDPSFNFSTMLPRDIGDDITNAGKKVEDKGDNLASNAADAIKDPSAAIKNLKANITDTVNDGKKAIEDAGTKLKDGLKNATAEIVSTFINETISTLNIEDFYLAHLMTYCSGRYTKTSSQNITFCSNHKPNHKYNVSTSTTTANSSHTADDPFAFITNLHFPDPVDFAMKAITLLSKIIAALYIVALILVFLSLLTSALTIPPTSKSNMLRYATLASALGAFLSLLLGTILVHFLCKKLRIRDWGCRREGGELDGV